MSIAVLVVTDGRDDYLPPAVASLRMLSGPITEWWMYDDTGDNSYRARLADRYPTFRHINGGPRQGFGGAIRSAWAQLRAGSGASWVWHHEQDFVINRPVNLDAVTGVMAGRPYLAQMALRRQPWNAEERAAGGIVEQHPGDYTAVADGNGGMWLEHRRFFTTNPCLYRRSLLDVGWPTGPQSEGHFGIRLTTQGVPGVAAAQVRFGYWGARDSPPWVHHIGDQRVGVGY